MQKDLHENDDDLDYNDGLGDLLKRRNESEFSWVKTTLVVLAIIAAIVIAVIFGTHYSQKMTSRSHSTVESPSVAGEQEATNKAVQALSQKLEILEANSQKLANENTQLKQELARAKTTTPRWTPPAHSAKAPAKQDAPVATPFTYKVIAGVFTDRAFAQTFAKELKGKGLESFIWAQKTDGKEYFRVQVGAFNNPQDAETRAQELKKAGLTVYVMKK